MSVSKTVNHSLIAAFNLSRLSFATTTMFVSPNCDRLDELLVLNRRDDFDKYRKKLKYYARIQLLFIDDFAISRYSEDRIKILYHLIKTRTDLKLPLCSLASMRRLNGENIKAMKRAAMANWTEFGCA